MFNPCFRGKLGEPNEACSCTPTMIERYRRRLSGPLLDRIDLHIEVPRVPHRDLADPVDGESSATIRARVEAARQIQRERFAALSLHANAHMQARHIRRFCPIDDAGQKLLEMVTDRLGLSARSYSRTWPKRFSTGGWIAKSFEFASCAFRSLGLEVRPEVEQFGYPDSPKPTLVSRHPFTPGVSTTQ